MVSPNESWLTLATLTGLGLVDLAECVDSTVTLRDRFEVGSSEASCLRLTII